MQLSIDAVSLARVMKQLHGNHIRFLLTLSTLRRLPHLTSNCGPWRFGFCCCCIHCLESARKSLVVRPSVATCDVRGGISAFLGHMSTHLTPLHFTVRHTKFYCNYNGCVSFISNGQTSAANKLMRLFRNVFALFLFAIKSLFTLVIIIAFMCLRRQN